MSLHEITEHILINEILLHCTLTSPSNATVATADTFIPLHVKRTSLARCPENDYMSPDGIYGMVARSARFPQKNTHKFKGMQD